MSGLIFLFVMAWLVGLVGKALMAKYSPEQYQRVIAAEERRKERKHQMVGLGIKIASRLIK